MRDGLRVRIQSLGPGNWSRLLETALPPGGASVMAVLPPDTPAAAFSAQVLGRGGESSNALAVNQPQTWWVQGDGGNYSTPGGWVRLLGRALTLVRSGAGTDKSGSAERLSQLAGEAAAAGDLRRLERLQASQRADAAARQRLLALMNTTLHLVPVGSGAGTGVTLTSEPSTLTAWSAWFRVPASLPPGRYTASVSNGRGPTVPLDCFVSPALPSVRWVDVRRDVWPPTRRLAVTDFGRVGTTVGTKPPGGGPGPSEPFAMPVNSTAALEAALKSSAAAGGGTVTFPAGVFVISTGGAGLAVPSGVVLQGARTDLTALKLGTNGTSLPPAEIARSAPERPGRWGLSDLTIYQMYVYRVLIYVGRLDDGFTMVRLNINSSITNSIMQWPCGQERVRIRANAFHCGQTCGPAGSEGGGENKLSQLCRLLCRPTQTVAAIR